MHTIARTCAEAGESPGQCITSSTSPCYVHGGDCYCDPTCTFYNDCCNDVAIKVGMFILL